MKKILVLMLVTAAVGFSTAQANEKNVPRNILAAFENKFSEAEQVTWVVTEKFYQAAFTLNQQRIFAIFNEHSELVSMKRHVSPLQLPLALIARLRNDYSGFWITDVSEIHNYEGTQYFSRIENANEILLLKSINGNEWFSLEKQDKL